jgi:hypothetical protein
MGSGVYVRQTRFVVLVVVLVLVLDLAGFD